MRSSLVQPPPRPSSRQNRAEFTPPRPSALRPTTSAHSGRADARRRLRRGLSLLEMMAVVTLLGILAAIIIPRVAEPSRKAKTSACQVIKSNIEIQAQLWCRNTGNWPAADLSDVGADPDYFADGLPTCPVDGSAYAFDAGTRRVSGHAH